MTPQFRDITSSSDLFDVAVFLLSILVTGPSSISISLLVLELGQYIYKGLTRNLEVRNTPVWFLPINWRLGKVRDTKFGTNVFNKMLSNAPKCQGYSSYRFWVIKAKPIVPTSPIIPRPRLGLNFEKWVGGVWTF